MVTIIFEPHSTTIDNESRLSSGWNDVALSDLGKAQAKDLGKRYNPSDFAAIFTSDLERAYETARLAFPGIEPGKLFLDWRLREINYGDFTQHPKAEVDNLKSRHISVPFPRGESYQATSARLKAFLSDVCRSHDGHTVMVIGHRATQYGLEHWINGVALQNAVTAPWKWQPGWVYRLEELPT